MLAEQDGEVVSKAIVFVDGGSKGVALAKRDQIVIEIECRHAYTLYRRWKSYGSSKVLGKGPRSWANQIAVAKVGRAKLVDLVCGDGSDIVNRHVVSLDALRCDRLQR